MKKIISLFTLFAVLTLMLTACASKLPGDMTEADVKKHGEEILNMLNAKEYDEITALFDEKMTEAMQGASLSEVWEPVSAALGTFDSIEKTAVAEKDGYAVYVVQVKYSEGSAVVQVSFNESYNVCGLFVQ